jgi:hypothetical protein
MGVSHGFAGIDAEMPTVRGGLCRAVHRRWNFRLYRAMDSDFDAGNLFDFAGISCS